MTHLAAILQLNHIMNRIKQESTWRGVILILTAFGVQLAPELQEAIITVGLAIVGAINVLKNK
tara:strand:+ start:1025 stop:1213 length:189 start_codon:yes stop_codon:yes gene_type:complete